MPGTFPRVPAKQNPFYSEKVGVVTISVGTEATNVIRLTITAKDPNGNAVSEKVALQWYFSTLSTGLDIVATAPSGGVAVGTKGALIENIADKAGLFVTNTSGVAELDLTDTGTPTFYLVVVLPDGSLQISGAVTFA